MPILSGNSVVEAKSPTIIYQGDTAHYFGAWTQTFGYRATGYGEMYKRQLWVAVVVNKRAGMVARLPLPVYRRDPQGRVRVNDHPYAELLRKPNVKHDPVTFWTWISATYDIFGEAFLGKIRDRGGRPVQLVPLHPTRMHETEDGSAWEYMSNDGSATTIRPHDIVHFKTYNPDGMTRGLSRLEPLRDTLANEDAARRATSSFWNNGARPGFALSHPTNLSQAAGERLRAQWDAMHGGAGNTGKTVILEEGMTAQALTINNHDAQYIDTRKLNREEVVAAYDMPPPAVHILDHATFSNITEQFRSLYRDSGAVTLGYFEAVLEDQVRGSFRPGASEPDFGDDVYAEFLLDEVLRGSFEARQEAYDKAKYMTLAEKRERENLPFIAGTDVILVNTADQPLDALTASVEERQTSPRDLVEMVQKVYLGVGTVLTAPEAREMLNRAGAGLEPDAPVRPPSEDLLPAEVVRSLMGRLSRPKSLADVDPIALTAGLNGHTPLVLSVIEDCKAAGGDVADLRSRLRALTVGES